jgi:hypothetical protein
MRAMTLFAGGILAALALVFAGGFAAGDAASAGQLAAGRADAAGATTVAGSGGGSVAACTDYAYQAIRARVRVTGIPAACRGLSPSQVTFAASTAIRMASGGGPKSAWRKQTAAAVPWVSSLLSGPAAVPPTPPSGGGSVGGSAGGTGGAWSRLGFSDLVAQVGGLLAWLAAAAAGGWILLRWWLAGGGHGARRGLHRLLHGSASAAPPAVTVGHVSLGLLGLLLWAIFMITGSAPLAWVCVCLLAPVAGLGMTVLLLGLPSPRDGAGDDRAGDVRAADGRAGDDRAADDGAVSIAPGPVGSAVLAVDDVRGGTAVLEAPAGSLPSTSRRSRGGMPVIAIAAHGVFVTIAIMFVILAAIGAG